MKRKTKNLICGLFIAAGIAGTTTTIYLTKSSSSVPQMMSIQQSDGNSQMTPPSNDSSSSSDSSTSTTPPEISSGDQDASSSNDSQTPPELPSGDGSQDTSSTTPPEKPNGDTDSNMPSTSLNDDMKTTDSPQQSMNQDMMNNQSNSSSKLKTILTYAAYIVSGLLISLTVIYLIMSKGNLYTFKETFRSVDKILICILSSVLLTAGITVGDHFISKRLSSTSSQPSEMTQSQGEDVTYNAANSITQDTEKSDQSYVSTTADENALSVSGNVNVTLSNITVDKSGDSDSGDNTNFYGINSGIIAKDGANLTIKNATITTTANGANGVFSYGGSATTNNTSSDGTTINISDSTITTTGDNAGGIMTTGGGTTNATNLTIKTSGTSSAAIRSDRGGGTVTVNKGNYTTTGTGSPTIYSTADITVSNATLTATSSEGVVIEGANSVTLKNCVLNDTNKKLNGQSTTYKNIFLYQSVSGDASVGTSSFTASNCDITTNKGDTFYITNTTAVITLENNEIKNNDSTGNFLRAQADSWGNSGSNGGIVTLTATNQTMEGDIVIDNISTLDMTMKKSQYTGTINGDNTAKSITLTLDKNSTITLTGDSYVTSLEDADATYSNINFNGYTLYVNGTAIN